MEQTQINRGPIQPVARGASFRATANTRPIPRNKTRFESGPNQMKCRLMVESRWLGSIARKRTLVPVSKSPVARPHHAERRSRSRALMGCRTSRARCDPADRVMCSGGGFALTSSILRVSMIHRWPAIAWHASVPGRSPLILAPQDRPRVYGLDKRPYKNEMSGRARLRPSLEKRDSDGASPSRSLPSFRRSNRILVPREKSGQENRGRRSPVRDHDRRVRSRSAARWRPSARNRSVRSARVECQPLPGKCRSRRHQAGALAASHCERFRSQIQWI